MRIIKDYGNFANNARKHAIGMMTAFGVYEYDEGSNEVRLSERSREVRNALTENYQLVPLWASFAIGVECLLKAVLCKHECLHIRKGKLSERVDDLQKHAANYVDAKRVLLGAGSIEVTARDNEWLREQLENAGIDRLYDIDTSPLGYNIGRLKDLHSKKVITEEERWLLTNSLLVLKDVRRNVDLHSFHSVTIGGSFNGDLENLYFPAINLLLNVYNRVGGTPCGPKGVGGRTHDDHGQPCAVGVPLAVTCATRRTDPYLDRGGKSDVSRVVERITMGLEHTDRWAGRHGPTPGNPYLNPPQVREGDKQSRPLAPGLWLLAGIGLLCGVVLLLAMADWITISLTPAPMKTEEVAVDGDRKTRIIRFDGKSWKWAGVYPGGIDYCFFEGEVYSCESPDIRLLVLRPTPERDDLYERIHVTQRKNPYGGWVNDGVEETWLGEGPTRHEIAHFKMGKLHGEAKGWDEMGRLDRREQYYNDLEHGMHESWYSNGQKEDEIMYHFGEQISLKSWNPDGSPFVRD